MKQVFILTQYSLPEHKRNMNAYQRVFYGANYAHIQLLIRRKQSVSRELEERVTLRRAPVENRWLFFAYALFLAIYLRFKGCRIIIAEPSGFAALGFLVKYLAGYFWVLDVWDTPRRRPGLPTRFSDRFTFFLMSFADLYLFSILPQAAPMLKINQEKYVQLYNAIDLRNLPKKPPYRPIKNDNLNLAFIRSTYTYDMGILILIQAAEKLFDMKLNVKIHLVGHIPKYIKDTIFSSRAAPIFKIHGFIPFSPNDKADFFHNIHIGLIPFMSTENLKYTFPIKVLEHLAFGNPVISSDLPGIRTMIIHEYNGLLVEPGKPEELAKAIIRLYHDKTLWEQLAWNALESAKKYDASRKNEIIFQEIFKRARKKNMQ